MTGRRVARAAAGVALGLLLAGCGKHSPSLLDPHGSEEHTLAAIWWLMFGLAAGVYGIVGTFIVWAILRGRRTPEPMGGGPSGNVWIAWGGVIVPVMILTVLAVTTVASTAELRHPEPGAVHVEVVGKRWWWEVTYPDDGVTTANEIHLPVGRQAEIGLTSDNVIHSFWVPQLAGKVDMIPGQHNWLRFTPTAVGTYRGECAEFCGIEHAKMDFLVVVQTQADYAAWVARNQLVPSQPDSGPAAQGELVFMREPCAGCHTIRGTQAQGTLGPDLTDIGARSTIAAATLPNTPGNLAGWIADAQSIKPGALMPQMHLSASDLQAVVAYLESLK
jgi:cytochrome c oxidase subunit 2